MLCLQPLEKCGTLNFPGAEGSHRWEALPVMLRRSEVLLAFVLSEPGKPGGGYGLYRLGGRMQTNFPSELRELQQLLITLYNT